MSRQSLDAAYGRQGGRIVHWTPQTDTAESRPSQPIDADQLSNYEVWHELLVGKTCTCPPGCTDHRWGDGATDCDEDCKPCQIMSGRTYEVPPKTR